MSSNRSSIPWMTIAGVSLSAAASFGIYQSVHEYGWEGTLRYLWEGDPYGPEVGNYIKVLETAEKSRVAQQIKLNVLEETLERARLDSVDDSSIRRTSITKEIVRLWIANYAPSSLEKILSELSHVLDRLAAQVDGIVVSQKKDDGTASSSVFQDIKRRKKLLSKQLVLDMERCDALMASYQVLQE
jgi:hypothetical protein